MAAKKKSILLRIPDELAEALHRWAQDELRSVNGQIEYLLREAVRKRTGKRIDESPRQDTGDENRENPDQVS